MCVKHNNTYFNYIYKLLYVYFTFKTLDIVFIFSYTSSMNYNEFKRNIGKAGLSLKEFAVLIKASPNSITNLASKEVMPKNLAIISVLLGELVDNDIEYRHLFEKMDLIKQKARVKEFGKKMRKPLS